MKPIKPESPNHLEQNNRRRWTEKIKQYLDNYYHSRKYKKMSCGSCYIAKCIGWARGDQWRRDHPKSLNKSHHKK